MARGLACKEVVELLTEYLEGALPRRTHKRVEKHLSICAGCRAYLAQMKYAIHATGMLTEEHLSESAKAELLEAFRGWSAP